MAGDALVCSVSCDMCLTLLLILMWFAAHRQDCNVDDDVVLKLVKAYDTSKVLNQHKFICFS